LLSVFFLFWRIEGKRETISNYLFIGLILIPIIIVTSTLFNNDTYSSFLAKTKYGGNVPIKVEYSSGTNKATTISGKLSLRTEKYIIVKTKDNYKEITFSNIVKIEY